MTAPLPPAFARATLVPLADHTGFLALMPTDGFGTDCPRCADGRAIALAVLRQLMPSGRWTYHCLCCDDL